MEPKWSLKRLIKIIHSQNQFQNGKCQIETAGGVGPQRKQEQECNIYKL